MSTIKTNAITTVAGKPILNSTGSIINYADNRIASTNDTYITIADGTVYDTPVSITYSPISATSKLLIKCQCQTRIVAATGNSAGIKRDGTAINGSFNRSCLSFFYKGDSVNHHYDIHCQTSVSADSTSATTFTMFIQPYGGIGEFNYGWGNMFIQVWEISQ
jgi:hypothetical protein